MRSLFLLALAFLGSAAGHADENPRLHFLLLELNSLPPAAMRPIVLARCENEFVRTTVIGNRDGTNLSRYLVPLSRFDPIQQKWVSRNCQSLRLALADSANELSNAVDVPLRSFLETRQPLSGEFRIATAKLQPVGYSLFPVKRNATGRIEDKLFRQIAWIRDHLWDRNYLFVFQPIAITVPGESANGFGNYPPLSPLLATALNVALTYTYYLDIKANGKAITGNRLGILGKQKSAGFPLYGGQAQFQNQYVVITPSDVTLEDDSIRLDLAIDVRRSSVIRRPHIIGRSVVQPRSIVPNSEVGIVGVSDRTVQIDSVVRPEELAEQIRKEPTSLKFGLWARFMILEIVRSDQQALLLDDLARQEDEPPLIEDDLRPNSDR